MITYINCARHLEDNVRRHVTKNNATNDKKEQIVNAIFNARTGLYSSRTRTQYSEMYEDFKKAHGKYFSKTFLAKLRTNLWDEGIEPAIRFKFNKVKWNNNRSVYVSVFNSFIRGR